MPVILSIVIVLFSLAFAIGVCTQVARGRLLLRYSLIWLVLAFIAIIFAVFPTPIFELAHLLGFDVPSNFVLFAGIFFLAAICLSLSVIVSRQHMKLKDAIQRIALLDNRIRQISNDHTNVASLHEDMQKDA